MMDGNRDDPAAASLDEHRQEPMHVIEIGQFDERGPVEELESATRVRRIVLENASINEIGDLGGQALRPRIVSRLPEAGHHRRPASFLLSHEARDIRRVVLAVAIERDDERSSRRQHPGAQSGALALGPRMLQDPKPVVAGAHLPQDGARVIAASVIDADELELDPVQSTVKVRDQPGHVSSFITHRNDDGEH